MINGPVTNALILGCVWLMLLFGSTTTAAQTNAVKKVAAALTNPASTVEWLVMDGQAATEQLAVGDFSGQLHFVRTEGGALTVNSTTQVGSLVVMGMVSDKRWILHHGFNTRPAAIFAPGSLVGSKVDLTLRNPALEKPVRFRSLIPVGNGQLAMLAPSGKVHVRNLKTAQLTPLQFPSPDDSEWKPEYLVRIEPTVLVGLPEIPAPTGTASAAALIDAAGLAAVHKQRGAVVVDSEGRFRSLELPRRLDSAGNLMPVPLTAETVATENGALGFVDSERVVRFANWSQTPQTFLLGKWSHVKFSDHNQLIAGLSTNGDKLFWVGFPMTVPPNVSEISSVDAPDDGALHKLMVFDHVASQSGGSPPPLEPHALLVWKTSGAAGAADSWNWKLFNLVSKAPVGEGALVGKIKTLTTAALADSGNQISFSVEPDDNQTDRLQLFRRAQGSTIWTNTSITSGAPAKTPNRLYWSGDAIPRLLSVGDELTVFAPSAANSDEYDGKTVDGVNFGEHASYRLLQDGLLILTLDKVVSSKRKLSMSKVSFDMDWKVDLLGEADLADNEFPAQLSGLSFANLGEEPVIDTPQRILLKGKAETAEWTVFATQGKKLSVSILETQSFNSDKNVALERSTGLEWHVTELNSGGETSVTVLPTREFKSVAWTNTIDTSSPTRVWLREDSAKNLLCFAGHDNALAYLAKDDTWHVIAKDASGPLQNVTNVTLSGSGLTLLITVANGFETWWRDDANSDTWKFGKSVSMSNAGAVAAYSTNRFVVNNGGVLQQLEVGLDGTWKNMLQFEQVPATSVMDPTGLTDLVPFTTLQGKGADAHKEFDQLAALDKEGAIHLWAQSPLPVVFKGSNPFRLQEMPVHGASKLGDRFSMVSAAGNYWVANLKKQDQLSEFLGPSIAEEAGATGSFDKELLYSCVLLPVATGVEVVAAGGSGKLFAAIGESARNPPKIFGKVSLAPIYCMDYAPPSSPFGQALLIVGHAKGSTKQLQIIGETGGQTSEIYTAPLAASVSHVRFSRNADYATVVTADGTLSLWDRAANVMIAVKDLDRKRVIQCSWHPDDPTRFAAALSTGNDSTGEVIVFDVQ